MDGVAEGSANLRSRLVIVFAGIACDRIEPSEACDVFSRLRAGVEAGDLAAQRLHHRGIDRATCKPALERGRLGQALHLHGPFDDLTLFMHADSVAVASHRHNPEVHARSQAPIEANLLSAEMPAFLQRAEIQEPELHRLLDLVRIMTRQEDDGNVRMANLHRTDRMGIRGRF